MDAVKFMKEFRRMCERVTDCKNCPLGIMHIPESKNVCALNVFFNAEFSVKAIEQWSIEHPNKTRLQDFLEKYPEATFGTLDTEDSSYPDACCAFLGYCDCVSNGNKEDCKKCWNEPVD